MKMRYLRGYDPEEIIEVVAISPTMDTGVIPFPYLLLTTDDGMDLMATYCDFDDNVLPVAGLPENF